MSNQNDHMDPNASSRKEDHIKLAFDSIMDRQSQDKRFFYEPLLAAHPQEENYPISICSRQMNFPIWVSSMTGGTEKAKMINHNLAKACGQFGLGMGLGSCRQLLDNDKRLTDFDVKHLMPEQPLLVNLGIAQIEKMMDEKSIDKIEKLISKLQADGLIIHVNPLQEWLQPEGDQIRKVPIDTISSFLSQINYPVIVKEVGQGMGPESLKALLKLPIEALDFGAHGGTNFAKLEMFRADEFSRKMYEDVANIGHNAYEMLLATNQMLKNLGNEAQCKNLIISGGIKNFLDGYYLVSNASIPAIYAQASEMLKYALQGYDSLEHYIQSQIDGFRMANKLLTPKAIEQLS